jgi:hypothetical protein
MKNIFETKEESTSRESVYFWMNKYISLLEKYNELLLKEAEDFDKEDDLTKSDLSHTSFKKSH